MLKRRVRGLLATVIGGALAGGIAGTVLGLIFLLTPEPKVVTLQPQFPGAIVLLPALLLGAAGAIGGGSFGALVMVTERGRSIENVRIYRVATWAALASAPAIRLVGWSWTTVAIGSVVSATIGAAAAWIAKRGATRSMVGQADGPNT